jgi:chorismate--pyruvate lyase
MKFTFPAISPTLKPYTARQLLRCERRGIAELQWYSLNSRTRALIPYHRLVDILDTSSLTQRLILASEGNFRVNVVKQGWQLPTFSERCRLKLRNREYALIREVELVCKGEVWVFARSVIPRSTLSGSLKHLENLGDRPLGASLFKEPSLERTHFEICQINNVSQLAHFSKLLGNENAWGRRSVFRLQGKQVLVSEIFMQTCPVLHN